MDYDGVDDGIGGFNKIDLRLKLMENNHE